MTTVANEYRTLWKQHVHGTNHSKEPDEISVGISALNGLSRGERQGEAGRGSENRVRVR